ncbi:hypothetical protein BQ8482_110964 [Mesorhizobium delmotii]|uniref:Uncharacterized protein n=1 Tax=Mesorhizobium delmotii TaxID=1631247 RepID=A0A2P9AD26_9HYPH|nr:hypothetical protein BQ8482_110964 [Mesorhizobium delmotii]
MLPPVCDVPRLGPSLGATINFRGIERVYQLEIAKGLPGLMRPWRGGSPHFVCCTSKKII